MEGISFVPLLSDPERSWKTAAFSFTIKSKRSALYRSVRTDRYSYIENVDGSEPELYDHQSDRAELVNLAGMPAMASELAKMKQLLHEGWRKAVPPVD
jgi:iduronate 2-sulfatase